MEFTLSPKIHNIWLDQYKLPYQYLQSPLNEKEFVYFFNSDKWQDFLGFNITTPYKEKVIKYLDFSSEEVQKIGACNTIHIKDGKKYGYNTDYIALQNALSTIEIESCLIVGAGGYAKTAYHAIKKQNPKCKIDICNRSEKYFFDATYIGNIENIKSQYDLIIIAIPRSNTYESLFKIINKNYKQTKIIDATYTKNDEFYTNQLITSGKDLLVEQARYAFNIWFEILPDILKI